MVDVVVVDMEVVEVIRFVAMDIIPINTLTQPDTWGK
jgi:hypothetical protein